ncbi:MAG: type II toxin-antitoxin system VapC family toxin [Verrucomicrobiales bacterium]|jgi:predicted nucleic acid-binding protein|nr:type II toxin-antitoxin system VapC family toxin [Verrucomicrobiales bacterium]
MKTATLVLDASTTLGFLLPDEQSAHTNQILRLIEQRTPVYVPAHWFVETVNGLLVAKRRQRINAGQMDHALRFVQTMSRATVVTEQFINTTLTLARRHQLTIYDAAYLELAIRTDSVLATTDRALLKAAKAERVDIV